MKTVRLKGTSLVGETHYEEGEVVAVADDRAHRMIAAGQAGPHDATFADADNAHEANPLGDTLIPIPRGAVPVHPPDALAPNVAEHPGLAKLVDVLGVQADVDPKGRTSTIPPVPTSEVASAEAVEASHRLANPPNPGMATMNTSADAIERERAEREAEGDAETADIRPGGRTAAQTAAGKGRVKVRPPAATDVKVPAADDVTGTPGPSAEAPKPVDAPKTE